jgi:putative transposase
MLVKGVSCGKCPHWSSNFASESCMDETYIKVKGVWKYLHRAVDKLGKIVDFLLTAKRDMAAAKRVFDKAMGANGDPDKVAMDKSGANKAAIDSINDCRAVPILVRQVKYLSKHCRARPSGH